MAAFLQDLNQALRLMRKSPVLVGVAVLSLALGIGANTAIFGIINALILRSLPVRDPQQLVSIGALDPQRAKAAAYASVAMLGELQKSASAFSNVFIVLGGGISNLDVNGSNYPGNIETVSGDYFPGLGVRPVLGRVLTREDAPLDGRPPAQVAVISYGCWRNRFGGDPGVIGKRIRVDDVSMTIIGVSPPKFTGMAIDEMPDAFVPVQSDTTDRYKLQYSGFARLKPGISIAQARAQIRILWPGILNGALPNDLRGAELTKFLALRPDIQPAARGTSYLRQKLEKPLEVLMALVGTVLLIACVNLANLLLARAAARQHEFGVRVAMGAARWQMVRMLLTEALLLSCTGASLGLLIAGPAARYLLMSFWTGLVPLSLDPSPDKLVLVFTVAIALSTGVLFGIVPAWRATRSDPATTLSQNAHTTYGRTGRFSRALLAAQVGLSFVLLIGATLFVRTLQNLRGGNLGYRSDHLLVMQLMPQPGVTKLPNAGAYYHELVARLKQLPGVESATYADVALATGFQIKGSVSAADITKEAVMESVGPGFFSMLGIRVLAGREFTWRDDESGPPVAIVSQSLARALFPGLNPVGETINLGTKLKVIAVVTSANPWNFRDREPLAIYRPLLQKPLAMWPNCIIRTRNEPSSLARSVARVVASLGRNYSLRTETFEQRANETLVLQRMIALLASSFSLLALLLAAIGLYGVMSYAVTRRTAEIGVRMALGAMRGDVLRMILGEVALLIAIGIAIALPVAFACGRLISAMLFGMSATDPASVAISVAILITTAAVAGFLPGRRASHVDPIVALRYE